MAGLYYGDEGSSELPSAEAVLSKLKSDGTFDQIRKLCVAAVQEEVSGLGPASITQLHPSSLVCVWTVSIGTVACIGHD